MSRIPMLLLLVFLGPATTVARTGEVSLTLDADEYVEGDTITITLRNDTDQAIELVSQPWWCIDRVDGEYPVCVGLPVVFELAAGDSLVGHHDTSSLPDPPGEYRVVAATGAAEPAPYRLLAAIDGDDERWGTIKARFR